jgi:hypothetical protein
MSSLLGMSSLFVLIHSFIQARAWLPDAVGGTIWFGPHAAHGTIFVPIAVGVQQSVPEYNTQWQVTTTMSDELTSSCLN